MNALRCSFLAAGVDEALEPNIIVMQALTTHKRIIEGELRTPPWMPPSSAVTSTQRVNILLPQARICGVCNAGEHMHSDKFSKHQPHLIISITNDVG